MQPRLIQQVGAGACPPWGNPCNNTTFVRIRTIRHVIFPAEHPCFWDPCFWGVEGATPIQHHRGKSNPGAFLLIHRYEGQPLKFLPRSAGVQWLTGAHIGKNFWGRPSYLEIDVPRTTHTTDHPSRDPQPAPAVPRGMRKCALFLSPHNPPSWAELPYLRWALTGPNPPAFTARGSVIFGPLSCTPLGQAQTWSPRRYESCRSSPPSPPARSTISSDEPSAQAAREPHLEFRAICDLPSGPVCHPGKRSLHTRPAPCLARSSG